MRRMNPLVGVVIISLGWILLTSCARFSKPATPVQPPVPFEEAVSALAADLLDRIRADRPVLTPKDKTHVMLLPFTDADTGEEPHISRKIESIFIAEGLRKFSEFDVAGLTSQNTGRADYLINGTIRMESYRDKAAGIAGNYYRLYGEITRLRDKTIIGRSSRWIADSDIDCTPTPIYRDSPLYLMGSRRPGPAGTPQQTPDKRFSDVSLETRALLIEARTAYENGRYEEAEALFRTAAGRKDGRDLDTYAGLYLANYQLGRLEEAEKAFAGLVAVSAEKYRSFTVKYLFGVNSVEFLKDKNLEERYQTWIRNIGKYFQQSKNCLRIVGHSSRTGSEEYNHKLSLERAKSIQMLLQKSFPEVLQRSEAVGRGYSENIVGTGTDDDRDALDRRVELFIIECR